MSEMMRESPGFLLDGAENEERERERVRDENKTTINKPSKKRPLVKSVKSAEVIPPPSLQCHVVL